MKDVLRSYKQISRNTRNAINRRVRQRISEDERALFDNEEDLDQPRQENN